MGKLVQINVWETQQLCQSWSLTFENVSFIVSDAPNLFHRSPVHFWNENLIVFAERVGLAKEIFVEDHSWFCNIKHQLMVYVVDQGLSGVDAHGWETFWVSFVIFVRTCTDGIQVSWDFEGLWENKTLRSFNLQVCVFGEERSCLWDWFS